MHRSEILGTDLIEFALQQDPMIKASGSNRAVCSKNGREKWIRYSQVILPPLLRNVLCHVLS
jgi:hypothetical protein